MIGVGLRRRSRGIPLAEARLLAIEEDKSRAVALGGRARRGGEYGPSASVPAASTVACVAGEMPFDTDSDFN